MSAFALFSNLSLFKQVSHEDLLSLIPRIALDFSVYQPGKYVLEAGEAPSGVLYLLEGRVLGRYRDCRQQFAPYDLLSFSGLFGQRLSTQMTLEAMDPSKVLSLDANSLTFLMQQHPSILATYLGWLSDVVDPIRYLHTLHELRITPSPDGRT